MEQKQFPFSPRPMALAENMITGDKYRITILTDSLIRMEYSESGDFEDRATQIVIDRDFPAVDYQVEEKNGDLVVVTKHLRLIYNRKAFSAEGLRIELYRDTLTHNSVWHYGDKIIDLGGTVRTLDKVDGACPLESGLISKSGFTLLDDSHSLILTKDGFVEPRKNNVCDLYFWGYGTDYLGCLKDFYHLCGKTPMLPRFALGNWWSRYYAYTEKSYLELLKRFDQEGIPFSVAVIDMDWHLVKIDPKYGSGWTGYTWNRDLFPDPERFLRKLHERGMRITLNVHPAEGVGAHEEMYAAMAKELGMDISAEEPIAFDITNPAFLSAYFKYLHHPQEEKGVDFWWIDWQQGGVSRMEGMDPLWMLNHFHFLDSGRNGKRPMTFSRYAGPGSHRYPIGFSGDTIISWESLRFQPYFTSTASNIGYGWWSHDIGGHMRGVKDDELECRWFQFGVFSPINRLHSTKNEFNGKEPWRFRTEVRFVMGEFLRLRHRLIPYLYTMNYRAWAYDTPLMLPLYYYYPHNQEAYEHKNEYFFGSELLVMPVTSPQIPNLHRAGEKIWLPEGVWFDFFTSIVYEGGRKMWMYRGLESIPVLVKAGGIVPMQGDLKKAAETTENPVSLVWRVYGGADGKFVLYEDDNTSCDYQKGICVETVIELFWNEDATIVIHPAKGQLSYIPDKRTQTIEFYGCQEVDVTCQVDGELVNADVSYYKNTHCLRISLPPLPVTSEVKVTFGGRPKLVGNDVKKLVYDFLDQAEMSFGQKVEIYKTVCSEKSVSVTLSQLQAMELGKDIMGCLTELLTAWTD